VLKSRWRRDRERTGPSPSALSGWLERFHDPASPKAVAGTAFIPAVKATPKNYRFMFGFRGEIL